MKLGAIASRCLVDLELATHWWILKYAFPHIQQVCSLVTVHEEPGRLQSMGSLESDMTDRLPFHFSLLCIGEGNGNPLQYPCLENPRGRGAWWAAVQGVAQSQTRLKRLSSSSSSREWLILPQKPGKHYIPSLHSACNLFKITNISVTSSLFLLPLSSPCFIWWHIIPFKQYP